MLGTLQEKVDPYLRPLYDALYDMIEAEKIEKLLDRNVIEVAPIAFMRGRTLNDSFIIVDEAQNVTPEQMKMVLTRQGFNSKMVVNGDVTQIDLPTGRQSGLIHASEVLRNVEGIRFVYFEEIDVVRHSLVQRIVDTTGLELTQVQAMLEVGSPAREPSTGAIRAFRAMLVNDLNRRRMRRRIAQRWRTHGARVAALDRDTLDEVVDCAAREMALAQQVALLQWTHRIFRWWHVAHRPVALTALIAVIIHVVVVAATGVTWLW